LIFAIPGSTVESFVYSLERVIALGCEHVSAYSLSVDAGTSLGRACECGDVVKVDEETDRAMYERAIDELEAAGLGQYEISNFARAGFECAHNLKYWANDAYIGIAPGAWSYYDGWRYSNVADIGKYCELVESGENARIGGHRSQGVEVACETAVLNLRRRKGICRREFTQRCRYDVMELFGETIERYVAAGLLETSDADGGRLYLSQAAFPIADSVLCDFSSV
jgi:oxygen-independent coproporphyrinogen-3 oxidase